LPTFVTMMLALSLSTWAFVNIDWIVNATWWWGPPHTTTLWVGQDLQGNEIRITAWHLYMACVGALIASMSLFFLAGVVGALIASMSLFFLAGVSIRRSLFLPRKYLVFRREG